MLKARAVIRTPKGPRTLITLDERPKGDVYIRLMSGVNRGLPPHDKPIIADRFSAHFSPNSPSYITIKKSTSLHSGEIEVSAFLTTAVKQSGVSSIFVHNATNLENKSYDIASSKRSEIDTGNFNPKTQHLVIGLFVSDKKTEIPVVEGQVGISVMDSRLFRFHILTCLIPVPSSHLGLVQMTQTFHPDNLEAASKEWALSLMNAKSPEDACQFFLDLAWRGTAENLRRLLSLAPATEPGRQAIEQAIASMPRIPEISF